MKDFRRCRRHTTRWELAPCCLMAMISLTILQSVEVQGFSSASKSFKPALYPSNDIRRVANEIPQRRIPTFKLNSQGDDEEKEGQNAFDQSTNIADTEEEFFLVERLQKADFLEIRRDAVLVTCFVLSRFLVYDVLTSTKVTPGWVVQDIVWVSGTVSSAVVLVVYWTLAGLLSRTFESTRPYGPVQVLVNVALCCPIWLATEHLFGFGPANIGGETLSQAIASGFLGLASFMTLSRALTTDWER